MKRIAALLLTLAVALCAALPVLCLFYTSI